MKYRVHVYMTVRIPFDGIEADSQLAAIYTARKMAGEQCQTLRDMVDLEAESAEEITGFLVDEEGDDDFNRSLSYNAEGETDAEVAQYGV